MMGTANAQGGGADTTWKSEYPDQFELRQRQCYAEPTCQSPIYLDRKSMKCIKCINL